MIDSNWHPLVPFRIKFSQVIAQILDTAIMSLPLGKLKGQRTMFTLGSLESVYFLLVLIELFIARYYGWGATSETRWKIGDFAQTRSVWT